MNKVELRKRFLDEKVREDAYSLDGGLPNEAFCLAQNGNKWEVYYSERGEKSGLIIFSKEEEACDYLYEWVTRVLKRMRLM